MNRKKRQERFHKEVVTYRYRDSQTGHYVSRLTKKGKPRKRIIREKILTLLTSDRETGTIRKYGSIREPSRQRLADTETQGKNVFLKGVFRRSEIWEKAVKKRATGVMVTIKGKGRGNKDTAIRTRVIFDSAQGNNPDYMQTVVLAKIMKMLSERELRLSDLLITSHKKYFQLKDVRVTVDYYSSGMEADEWDEEGSISVTPRKRRRKGKRRKSRKRS